jgi:hypothetical protein
MTRESKTYDSKMRRQIVGNYSIGLLKQWKPKKRKFCSLKIGNNEGWIEKNKSLLSRLSTIATQQGWRNKRNTLIE